VAEKTPTQINDTIIATISEGQCLISDEITVFWEDIYLYLMLQIDIVYIAIS